MKKLLCLILIIIACTAPSASADFAVVPIEKVIDGGLAAFIERAIDDAAAKEMEGIIFHIDTPGGRVDSAVFIKDTILKSPITTIAFVDKNAISAGALISLACDSLYMSTGSSIGAATAVDLQGKKASEKVISYFRAQMRATAEATGRRPDIAEAMVDEELEIEEVSEKGMLLTLTYKEALELEISNGTVETIDEVLETLGKEESAVVEYVLNWAELVVRLLTHPMISSLLMSVGFIGLIIEVRTPGWGIGGTIAIVALALFFGSHYIVRLAAIGELLLFGGGIVLLTLEVFVIPGFGIAGVGGISLILISLYLSLIGNIPDAAEFLRAFYTFCGAILITIAAGYILIRIFPKTPLYGKIMLETVESAGAGFKSADIHSDLIGVTGVVINDLRPVGKAEINGKRLDVVTEGGYIEKETAVIVTEVDGSRIVVRENKKS
jgi:membrane-bound serine protease (ClpP class)